MTSTNATATIAPKTRPRSLNSTRFLNRRACRDYLMQTAELSRAHKFSRVSGELMVWLNGVVRKAMDCRVHAAPSKGRTLV